MTTLPTPAAMQLALPRVVGAVQVVVVVVPPVCSLLSASRTPTGSHDSPSHKRASEIQQLGQSTSKLATLIMLTQQFTYPQLLLVRRGGKEPRTFQALTVGFVRTWYQKARIKGDTCSYTVVLIVVVKTWANDNMRCSAVPYLLIVGVYIECWMDEAWVGHSGMYTKAKNKDTYMRCSALPRVLLHYVCMMRVESLLGEDVTVFYRVHCRRRVFRNPYESPRKGPWSLQQRDT